VLLAPRCLLAGVDDTLERLNIDRYGHKMAAYCAFHRGGSAAVAAWRRRRASIGLAAAVSARHQRKSALSARRA